MPCNVCGHTAFHPDQLSKTFTIEGKGMVVEGIPAELCNACGEANFSAEVGEQVRRLVHEPHQPTRVIEAEVLQFNAA